MAAATSRPPKIVHVCSECGTVHPKWAGRCSGCGDWNTLVEDIEVAEPAGSNGAVNGVLAGPVRPGPARLGELTTDGARAVPTSIPELDRVLGGGLVPGSVTLLGGEPGIGKSTLLLQLLAHRDGPSLYVSAEESAGQVSQRAERLGLLGHGGGSRATDRHHRHGRRAGHPHHNSPNSQNATNGGHAGNVWLHSEVSLAPILAAIDDLGPELVVIDSIQTIADPALAAMPGSVGQVRGCAQRLVNEAKARGITVVLVGHVTKEGSLAGPRVLEHIVDTVLAFEGDRHHALRLLRATKHRFGSTAELGLFEMTAAGLAGVPDPSSLFLADRRTGVPGSVVVPTMEGQRPIVVEVQSLTNPAVPGVPPRRSALGTDSARLSMLMAVLGRRSRIEVGNQDVYVSAAGGVKLSEPGLDLGVCLAVASALRDEPLAANTVVFGEVGLGGELRQVAHAPRRLAEAARLGFRRAVVPANTAPCDAKLDVVRAQTLNEAIAHVGLRTRSST